MQLLSVPPYAPPPDWAELPVRMQLETTELVESQYTPPPYEPEPPVTVKPESLALLARDTHGPPPEMVVNCGPLTLRTVSGLLMLTPPA